MLVLPVVLLPTLPVVLVPVEPLIVPDPIVPEPIVPDPPLIVPDEPLMEPLASVDVDELPPGVDVDPIDEALPVRLDRPARPERDRVVVPVWPVVVELCPTEPDDPVVDWPPDIEPDPMPDIDPVVLDVPVV